jgi:hypothetical protein
MKRATPKTASAREALRRRYRPKRVRILFVGEAPPASGRFFYSENSGLYRAVRSVFARAFPEVEQEKFLAFFAKQGCYLVDLCGQPVDQLTNRKRRQICLKGEARLSQIIKRLQPKIIVTIVRSIAAIVMRAQERAGWQGQHLEVPYPGRWKRNRYAFGKKLRPLLLEELR